LGPIRIGPSREALTFPGVRAFALRHPALVSLLVYGVVVALLRPAAWSTPLFEDPAQNLYVGDVIFDGGAPYADAANNKGPLTYLLFGLLGLITGTSNVVLQLAVVLVTPIAAMLVAGYVSRYAGRAVGFLAGLAFALFSSTGDLLGFEPMTEVFGMVPMTAAWYLASRGTTRSAAGAGLCAAVATLMAPAFAIVIPIAALELWRRGRERGTRLLLFAWATAAAANTIALVMLWLGLAGAIDDMLTQVLGGMATALGGGPAPETSGLAREPSELYRFFTIPAGALWIAAAIGSLVAWRTPRLRPLALPALLWLVLTFVRVKLADDELDHQFYLALPGIALGLAAGIAALWGPAPRQRVALAALVLAVPVAAFVLGPQWRALQLPAGERFGGGDSYALAEPVADFLGENTTPEDRIFVGGHSAQVYWLAERKAPTRFFDSFPVEQEASYRRERDRDLQDSPPKAIVIMPNTPPDEFVRDLITRLRYQLAFEERGARVFLRF
jgi:MFS family permease